MMQREWMHLEALPVEQKLNAIKKPLRKWNKDVSGKIYERIKALEEELRKVDRKLMPGGDQPYEEARRRAL